MRKTRKVEPASYRLFINPYLVKSLDISTGHLTKEDNDLLTKGCLEAAVEHIKNFHQIKHEVSDNPVTAYKYEYGYFVFCDVEPSDLLAVAEYGYSKQFVDILRRAKELGCKYVQFDSEGIGYEDLETYKW